MFAAVGLRDYAPDLRHRPNAPGTHRVCKTYAPPRLIHFRTFTETHTWIGCASHRTCHHQTGPLGFAAGLLGASMTRRSRPKNCPHFGFCLPDCYEAHCCRKKVASPALTRDRKMGHVRLTTLPACGLDQIHPETHRARKASAHLLLLGAGLPLQPATRPYCKTRKKTGHCLV